MMQSMVVQDAADKINNENRLTLDITNLATKEHLCGIQSRQDVVTTTYAEWAVVFIAASSKALMSGGIANYIFQSSKVNIYAKTSCERFCKRKGC